MKLRTQQSTSIERPLLTNSVGLSHEQCSPGPELLYLRPAFMSYAVSMLTPFSCVKNLFIKPKGFVKGQTMLWILCVGIFLLNGIPTTSCYGQTAEIDSLKSALTTVSADTVSLKLYTTLSLKLRYLDSDEAIEYAVKALNLAKQIGHNKGIFTAYHRKGLAAIAKGDYEMAAEDFGHMVEKANQEQNPAWTGMGYEAMGMLFHYQAKYELAIENYESGAVSFLQTGGELQAANIYNNMGVAYSHLGDNAKALDQFENSMRINQAIGHQEGLAGNYVNMSSAAQALGQYGLAIEYAFEGLDVCLALDDHTGVSKIYNNIGKIYRFQDDLKTAREYFQKSLDLKKELNDQEGLASVYNNIGKAYEAEQNLDQALEYFLLSLQIALDFNFKDNVAYSYNTIGGVYLAKGQYNQALHYIMKSYAMSDEIGARQLFTKVNCNLGLLYFEQKEYYLARKHLLVAIQLSRELSLIKELRLASGTLASVEFDQKNYKEAFEAQQIYQQTSDSLHFEENIATITRLKLKHDFKLEKDSLDHAAEQERLTLQADIDSRRAFQTYTSIGLSLAVFMLVIALFFYQSKRKANQQLVELNSAISDQNDQIKAQKDQLERAVLDLGQTQRQLIHSEKMASLGVLVSGIGHEINNPLNFIMGGASLLREACQATEKPMPHIKEYLGMIEEGQQRISKIVGSLANFNTALQTEEEECMIEDILENCLSVLNPQMVGRVQIERDYSAHCPSFRSSKTALHQLFLNLLNNALQAILEEGVIQLRIHSDENWLHVSIEDNGTGIPSELHSKIGTPFFTTKAPDEGKGLGLFIAYDIIAGLGGSIRFESEEKKGSTFHIQFPLN